MLPTIPVTTTRFPFHSCSAATAFSSKAAYSAAARIAGRSSTDAIGDRAGFAEGEIRLHKLRHTYCAARLQTLDNGAPVSEYTVMRELAVSEYTVMRELGHSSPSLARRVYGHLGEIRQRSETVEYRVEDYVEKLGDRLKAFGQKNRDVS